jgi:hypothetical protein
MGQYDFCSLDSMCLAWQHKFGSWTFVEPMSRFRMTQQIRSSSVLHQTPSGADRTITSTILYKHTTQNYTYVIRKHNLTTSLLFQKISLHVSAATGHLQVIFFLRFLTLLRYIHRLYKCEAIYCFLICMYTLLRKFLKYTTFYIRITQNAYNIFT